MKAVRHYQTSDEKFFDTPEEASEHERLLAFCTVYEERPVREDVSAEQLAAWLTVNKEAVQDFYRKHPKKVKADEN